MILLSRRCLLGLAAVVDIAIHSRPLPVAAKMLAERHNLPARHLETLLQTLVHANILKSVRGPRGGYELARERRRIFAGDIVRAVMKEGQQEGNPLEKSGQKISRLGNEVIGPVIEEAGLGFLASLDALSLDTLCQSALSKGVFADPGKGTDFAI